MPLQLLSIRRSVHKDAPTHATTPAIRSWPPPSPPPPRYVPYAILSLDLVTDSKRSSYHTVERTDLRPLSSPLSAAGTLPDYRDYVNPSGSATNEDLDLDSESPVPDITTPPASDPQARILRTPTNATATALLPFTPNEDRTWSATHGDTIMQTALTRSRIFTATTYTNYTFSQRTPHTMLVVQFPPSVPALYHVSVERNCMRPLSHFTVIRRGDSANGQFVAELQ